jgi:hypothetical protein
VRVSGSSLGGGEFGDEVHLLDGRLRVVHGLQLQHRGLGEVATVAGFPTSVRTYLGECRVLPGLDLDVNECLRIWGRALDSFGDDRPSAPHWVHGDLFAENLLLREGRLAAVLDFGGLSGLLHG